MLERNTLSPASYILKFETIGNNKRKMAITETIIDCIVENQPIRYGHTQSMCKARL